MNPKEANPARPDRSKDASQNQYPLRGKHIQCQADLSRHKLQGIFQRFGNQGASRSNERPKEKKAFGAGVLTRAVGQKGKQARTAPGEN